MRPFEWQNKKIGDMGTLTGSEIKVSLMASSWAFTDNPVLRDAYSQHWL